MIMIHIYGDSLHGAAPEDSQKSRWEDNFIFLSGFKELGVYEVNSVTSVQTGVELTAI